MLVFVSNEKYKYKFIFQTNFLIFVHSVAFICVFSLLPDQQNSRRKFYFMNYALKMLNEIWFLIRVLLCRILEELQPRFLKVKYVLFYFHLNKHCCVFIQELMELEKRRCPRISDYLLSVPSNLRSFRPYFDKKNESVKRCLFYLWDNTVSENLLSFSVTFFDHRILFMYI